MAKMVVIPWLLGWSVGRWVWLVWSGQGWAGWLAVSFSFVLSLLNSSN